MAITLVVADEHPLILFALETLFAAETDFAVLAQCRDGAEVLQAVRQHQPDVLVLTNNLSPKGGMAVLRDLTAAGSTAKPVLLTAAMDGEALLEAIRLGVRGIVLLDTALQLLIPCIRKVHAGGEWLERDSVRLALDKILQGGAETAPATGRLSPHEAKIVQLVAEGLSNKEIARRINSSEGAVKAYLHRIYLKLNVRGRVDLARRVQEKKH